MAKLKKQSKRMTARKRYKIERKVKEHKRKTRKDAKKKEKSKKLKKDPGIPNLYPFKEQLLKQIEQRKMRTEEERERQKRQRQREHAKKRSLQGLQNDAQRRTKEFEKRQQLQSATSAAAGTMEGLTEQSMKAYYREFKRVVEASDVVLEVLDARDPLGCRCPQVEEAVLSSGTNKKLILVLNKIDLVPKEIVELWLKHLRNEFPAVAFKASTQTQKHNLSQKKLSLRTAPTTANAACLGAEVLLKLLGNYCRNADIKTSIMVGVVGLPNVGKSSIINSLKRSKACTVGATPGVTRSLQEVQLDKHIKLLDSPGIVMATGSGDPASIVLRNCIKIELLADPIPPVEAILRRCNRLQVLEHYCLPEYDDVQEFLSHLAKRTGKLKKGGIPDIDTAARSVLRDWNTGRITFYTHPPEQHSLPSHISAEIVKQWGEAFDMKSLEDAEKNDLSALEKDEKESLEGFHTRYCDIIPKCKVEGMMVVEPSDPVAEVFGGEGEEESAEESAEESELEEEMVSEASDSESSEEMEEEVRQAQGEDMTVVLGKRRSKSAITTSSKSTVDASRPRALNPQDPKSKKKTLKKQPMRRQQNETHRSQLDSDDDVVIENENSDGDVAIEKEDAYNFDDYF